MPWAWPFFMRIAERSARMPAKPFESQLERLARTLTEQFGVTVLCPGGQNCTGGKRILLPSLMPMIHPPLPPSHH
jgi:hypothetical protein